MIYDEFREGGERLMGFNIYLVNFRNGEQPEWDSSRHGADKLFVEMLYEDFPHERHMIPEKIQWGEDPEFYYRPTNFEFWKSLIKRSELQPKERYYKMLEILDKDSNVWINISY